MDKHTICLLNDSFPPIIDGVANAVVNYAENIEKHHGHAVVVTPAVPGADGWAVGQYGIRAPVPERSTLLQPEQLDLVLVPCTAFDADCYRVGMGKGYYDRYLPRCTRAVKIGIALEVQRVPRAAVDAHDQRLDAFVTERGSYTWK